MKKITIFLLCLIAILVLFIVDTIENYTRIISEQEHLDNQLYNIEQSLKQRILLSYEIIDILKGHDNAEEVNSALSYLQKTEKADTLKEKLELNMELQEHLEALVIKTVTNYPKMKSSESYVNVLTELLKVQSGIEGSHTDYNNYVQWINYDIMRYTFRKKLNKELLEPI